MKNINKQNTTVELEGINEDSLTSFVYSNKTKKAYKSIEEARAAEAEYDKAAAEKAKKASERESRAKEIAEARKHLQELERAFIKDYGSYHYTFTSDDLYDEFNSVFDAMRLLF